MKNIVTKLIFIGHISESTEGGEKMEDFGKIYEEYMQDVYRYVLAISRNPHIAEEITQETFFKALKNIDKFKGECKLSVWLCQIAKNTYYSYCEEEKRRHGYVVEDSFVSTEALIENKEAAFELHKKLHGLPEPYKEVFSLRVFGELPFEKIAELFGKTESWARVTFYRAKLKMKEAIDE